MIINGPNLNFLGIREPHIYGYTTLGELEAACKAYGDHMGADVSCHQTNFEGAMIELIQSARANSDALIINPAGYSFTSVSVVDALKIVEKPIIEIHIGNNHARDELHQHSVVSGAVTGVICGLGHYGYIIAMQWALHALGKLPDHVPAAMRPPFKGPQKRG